MFNSHLLLPTILLISIGAHRVWRSSTSSGTSILTALGVIRRANSITSRGSSWTRRRRAASRIWWCSTLSWIWSTTVTTLTPTIRVVSPTWITAWRIPTRTSRRTTRLPVVMMARSARHRSLRIVYRMIRSRPMLGMRLPCLLDGRQASMLLWMLQFLSLCHFFILSLLLPFFLCLELVWWFIFR